MTRYSVSPPSIQLGVYADWGLPYSLTPAYHRWPFHVVGRSGGGKSTLLGNLAEQFVAAGEGVLVIDIKDGQLARDIASRTAFPDRLKYVAPGQCWFNRRGEVDPDGEQYAWGLNPLEFDHKDAQHGNRVVSSMMDVFARLGTTQIDFTQVRRYLRAALRLSLVAERPTLMTTSTIIRSQDYRVSLYNDRKNRERLSVSTLSEWQQLDSLGDRAVYDKLSSSSPRMLDYTEVDVLHYMLGQDRTTLKIAEWLDAGMLVVVDCVSGLDDQTDIELANSIALGNLILAVAVNAAQIRRVPQPPPPGTRYWRFILDEMDMLAGNAFAPLVDKLRSRCALPVMAHQSRDQFPKREFSNLLGVMDRCRVRLDLPQGDQDIADRRFVVSEEELVAVRNLDQFTARLTLNPGLTDTVNHETIALEQWRRPVVAGQLEKAIAAQFPSTRPISDLKPIFTREYGCWSAAFRKRPIIDQLGREMMDPEDEQPEPLTTRARRSQSQRGGQQSAPAEAATQAETVPGPEPREDLPTRDDRSGVSDDEDARPVPSPGRRSRSRTPLPRRDQ